MKDILDHAALKAKQRAIRKGFPETMGLRAHRAISWIGRAMVRWKPVTMREDVDR